MKNDVASMRSVRGEAAPVLQSVQADGRLEGLVLSMTLRQVFLNASSENLEVVYTFPLAWGAVLLGLDATLGGKRQQGVVLARREATEKYEAAVEKGDAPVMLQKLEGGMFSAQLGSLQPGEEAVIEIRYAQLLAFEQDRVRLVLPTTIAPRYGDAVKQAGLQPQQVPSADLMANYGFGLSLEVAGTLAQARITSPSHKITAQANPDGIRIALQGNAWLDRDFVLLLEGLAGQSFGVSGPDVASGDGHVATLLSFCPRLPQPASHAPMRLKILVDCSGSMAGESIAKAREALHSLAKLLAPSDQFSYTRFGSRQQRVLGCSPATRQGLADLSRAISETGADLGGTEMYEALQDTFALTLPKPLSPAGREGTDADDADVLLITDGEVWDAQRIVDEARRSGHRIYALGVGSAPAESLLRELAETSGGACEMVHPGDDMQAGVARLLSRMRSARPVRAELQTSAPALWASALPRRLADGETVHVFIRSAGPLLGRDAANGARRGDRHRRPHRAYGRGARNCPDR